MKLAKRIEILTQIGHYLSTDHPRYQQNREMASLENKWFLPEYVFFAGKAIAKNMLNPNVLNAFAKKYQVPDEPNHTVMVGIVFAGNIPYVGLHDLICSFLFGYKTSIKLSSKDTVLTKKLMEFLLNVYPEIDNVITIKEMLKGCSAYLATGSNNSARYFEYYFGKYPNIIRKNKTSVAILDGTETEQELGLLADDIQLYFGLGCRNVTQLLVPKGYDFVPLLNALKKYSCHIEHNSYKNNFDYQLTIAMLNHRYYMTNGSIILIENPEPFSPISLVHYQFYDESEQIVSQIRMVDVQCVIGKGFIPFGQAQHPRIDDFADGVDTMAFLKKVSKLDC